MKRIKQTITLCGLFMLYHATMAQTGTVTDIDGNVYATKVYGTMEWMTENLKTTHFRDGTPIKYINAPDEVWANDTVAYYPSYCDYDNLPVNGIIYGHLYNWYAVIDTCGICPSGWHVADTTEWVNLTREILGSAWAWGAQEFKWTGVVDAGTKMKSANYWKTSSIAGDNESGFNVLPGGIRRVICGGAEGFHEQQEEAYYWTPLYMHVDSIGNGRQHVQFMHDDDEMIFSGGRFAHAKSVRCMRYVDPTSAPGKIIPAEDISIYPNPASEYINIGVPCATKGSYVQLYNTAGLLVIQAQLEGNQTSIDISGLQKGLYICKMITGDNKSYVKQMLKQ